MWEAVDWVYPPYCGGCNQFGERWCDNCQASIETLPAEICPVCGNPNPGGRLCGRCLSEPPAFTQLRSAVVFNGPIRKAIHRLKYDRDIGLGEALAKQIIDLVAILDWPLDCVTSVPLSNAHLTERGYNQSNLLARPLALVRQIPFLPQALKRTRETRTQVGLSAKERDINVRDAFWANANLIRNKTVVVIDDVTTTGSTLRACASALHAAGALSVYGLTLARAVLQDFSSDSASFAGIV
ncbi:predicted amidophosphoribosyltransferase [Longilinea arvoryzae]|uniref:Predicted amidophosphoribosyltransferase n=1 Tax=Longilinea arvoryzae TaxID=360412 RepID=A0A0S7BK55_9CHLR|nr:predicted amidophosphoribosyltransferase [Longilinea arvoryzae]